MLTSNPTSLKYALNRANLQSLTPLFAAILLGDVLRRENTQLRAVALTTDPYGPASNTSIVLPDDAKCATVLKAYARAGSGTVGELTVEPLGASLSPGQCAPSIDGNIIFDSSDAWTSVDVLYTVQHLHVIEITLPVVTGVVTLPASVGTACELLECQRADTSTAAQIVLAPSGAAPATGSACFNLAKTEVLLHVADAAVSVRLKLGVVDPVDVNALLEASAIFI